MRLESEVHHTASVPLSGGRRSWMTIFGPTGAGLTWQCWRRLRHFDLAVERSLDEAGDQLPSLDRQPRPCISHASEGRIDLDVWLATGYDQLNRTGSPSECPFDDGAGTAIVASAGAGLDASEGPYR